MFIKGMAKFCEIIDQIKNPQTDPETSLKAALKATDDKVLEAAECQIAGRELPADIIPVLDERQGLREQIAETVADAAAGKEIV